VSSNNNGLDALIRPPFIFLPFLAALALLGAIAYWALGRGRRSDASLPAAAIVHRSVRPGYAGAEFDIRPMPLGPTPQTEPPPAPPDPPADGGEEPPTITES
jgi:hypothetical protein